MSYAYLIIYKYKYILQINANEYKGYKFYRKK